MIVVVIVGALAALSPRVEQCLQQAKSDAAGAAVCLDELEHRADIGDDERAEAHEAARVVARLLPHLPEPAPVAPPVTSGDAVERFVTDGHLEAVVNGAAFGAVAGFTATAGVLSATRTSESEALPLLLAAPAVGLVVGGVGAWAAVEGSGAGADDVAFVSSTAWAGLTTGFTLQLAVFADSRDVQAAPLRFFTTLAGGALGVAAGVGWAPFLDVTAADVSLANSGFFWGATLTAITIGAFRGGGLDFASGVVVVGGGALIPWTVLLALHPLIDLHRVSTWAIDVGGAIGVVGGAAFAAVVSVGVGNGDVFLPVFGGSVAAGLGVGVGVAVAVDAAARSAFDDDGDAPPPLALRPTLLPARDGLAPGAVVVASW